jgi:hypothetical protein
MSGGSNAAALAAQMAAITPKGEIKVKTPETFDGRPENTKRWLGSIQRYLDMNSHVYSDNDKKILFALSYLQEGTAESWVEDFTEEATKIGTSGQSKGYGSFTDFKTAFLSSFGPANVAAAAMQDLTKLRQSTCDSLTDYVAEFKLLAGRAGITHIETFRYLFLGGLNDGLKRAILSDDIPQSNTDLVKKALAKQANFEELKNLRNLYGGGGGGSKKQNPRRARYQSSHDPNAMEVDRLSPEEREDCRKQGLCFKCRQRGHMANDQKFHPRNGGTQKGKGKTPMRQLPEKEEEDAGQDSSDEEESTDVKKLDF